MPGNALWAPQEDEALRALVEEHGPKKWSLIASKLKTKGSKQCRRRWKNYLNAERKSGGWTAEEDQILMEGHKKHGNRWTEIAKLVGGRTDNAVKNRWAALCKRNHKIAKGQVVRPRGGRKTKAKHETSSDSEPSPEPSDDDTADHRSPSPPRELPPLVSRHHHEHRSRAEPPHILSVPPAYVSQQLLPLKMEVIDGGIEHSKRVSRTLVLEPPTKRRQLDPSLPSMRVTPRTPRTPQLLVHAQEAAARQAAAKNFPAVKRPELSISIPNAASLDPQPPLPTNGLEIRVFRDLLTPSEIQYAKELNDMDLPLQINIEDDPPLSTSRRATENAMAALASPSSMSMADFADVLTFFQTGLTPRSTHAGQGHHGATPFTQQAAAGPSTRAQSKANPRNGANDSLAKGKAASAAYLRSIPGQPPLSSSAAALVASAAVAAIAAAASQNNSQHMASTGLPYGIHGNAYQAAEVHEGHRQLVAKLLMGAKSAEEEVRCTTASAGDLQGFTFYGMHSPSKQELQNTVAALQQPGSCGPGGALSSLGTMHSPGFGPYSSRGYPRMDVVITPNFSQHELSLLLDALNGDDAEAGSWQP